MPKFNRGDIVKMLFTAGGKLPEGSYCIVKGLTPIIDDSTDEDLLQYDVTLYIPDVDAAIETTAVQAALAHYPPVDIPVIPIPDPLQPQNLPSSVAYGRIAKRISERTYAIKMNHWKSWREVVSPTQMQSVKSAYDSYVEKLMELFKSDLMNVFNQFFRGDRELFDEVYAYICTRTSDMEEIAEEMYQFVSVFYGYNLQPKNLTKKSEIINDARKNVARASKSLDAAWRRWEAKSSPDQHKSISEDLFGAYAYLVSMQEILIGLVLAQDVDEEFIVNAEGNG